MAVSCLRVLSFFQSVEVSHSLTLAEKKVCFCFGDKNCLLIILNPVGILVIPVVKKIFFFISAYSCSGHILQ